MDLRREKVKFLKEQQKKLKGGYHSQASLMGCTLMDAKTKSLKQQQKDMKVYPPKKVKVKLLKKKQKDLKKYPPKKLNERMLFY